jgi:putative effector of murein hydrolase
VIKDPSLAAGRHITLVDSESLRPRSYTVNLWNFLADYWPLFVSITCAMIIGGPVSAATGDPRVLDGCMLWFIWYLTVKSQFWLKTDTRWKIDLRIKRVIVTMMNPVLMTTLLGLAYTRIKALAHTTDLARVLHDFSRGTPLYAIWTASVTGSELTINPDLWFGAGDLALSILECGIVMWGFKLYECRSQLFSFAGLITILISIAAAAGNVFVCAAISRGLGLDQAESLSFAARSTTLALAKPAIDLVQGNLAVNAALVVSNGIVGQLLYPYILPRLNVESEEAQPSDAASLPSAGTGSTDRPDGSATAPVQTKRYDTPTTIAAGIAVGINGAAMGVAYLYENKSRAAPYAALSMTVFGVFTVVFITVDPFKAALLTLSGS